MPIADVFRRYQRGYRTLATYDELQLCESSVRDFRHIDYLAVWNEDCDIFLATFWVITETHNYPIYQIVADDKTEPHTYQVDFVMRPYDGLRVRFYDGCKGDKLHAWCYGTVMRDLAGEAL